LESSALRLYLIRHTEPEGGSSWTILGHKDTPLSEDGKRHAEEIAKQYADVPLDAVYCSDLERAWWTAELVAKSKGLTAHRLEALRELDCGVMDGLKRDEARKSHPEVFEGLRNDPVNYRIPGGETMLELADRVKRVMEEMKAAGNRRVLVVAHAVVNRVVLCDALGLPLELAYRIDQSYGGLNVIEYGGRHPMVRAVNSPVVPPSPSKPWKDL
jgi:broad specificity phosphatase PhoE